MCMCKFVELISGRSDVDVVDSVAVETAMCARLVNYRRVRWFLTMNSDLDTLQVDPHKATLTVVLSC